MRDRTGLPITNSKSIPVVKQALCICQIIQYWLLPILQVASFSLLFCEVLTLTCSKWYLLWLWRHYSFPFFFLKCENTLISWGWWVLFILILQCLCSVFPVSLCDVVSSLLHIHSHKIYTKRCMMWMKKTNNLKERCIPQNDIFNDK